MGRGMIGEDANAAQSASEFLTVAGDEEVLAFMRRLSMFANQDGERITLADLIYEMLLSPFVKQAWTEVKGSPGIPGRLAQITKVYAKAEADFEAMTGRTRRLNRKINLPAFLDSYTTIGMP